jgi:PAS domain S-box-containing protein
MQDHERLQRRLEREQQARKQAEGALLAAQGRLAHLLTSSRVVIFSLEAKDEHQRTFISENVRDFIGYEPEECLADPDFWSNHVHPDDRDGVLERFPSLYDAGYLTQEYRFRLRDGSYRWVCSDLQLIYDEDGAPLEIVGSWSDINERKNAEEALRDTAEVVQLLQVITSAANEAVSVEGALQIALDRVSDVQPNLILLDLMMPEMDGFGFLVELRNNQPRKTIPVVVVTGADLSEADHRNLNGGVEKILKKSAYSREELFEEVRAVVAQYVKRDPGHSEATSHD